MRARGSIVVVATTLLLMLVAAAAVGAIVCAACFAEEGQTTERFRPAPKLMTPVLTTQAKPSTVTVWLLDRADSGGVPEPPAAAATGHEMVLEFNIPEPLGASSTSQHTDKEVERPAYWLTARGAGVQDEAAAVLFARMLCAPGQSMVIMAARHGTFHEIDRHHQAEL